MLHFPVDQAGLRCARGTCYHERARTEPHRSIEPGDTRHDDGRDSCRRTFHQPRLRRECLGELMQIDGSDHREFEDRGAACTLLVFIDGATSTLMQLRFVTSESTFIYFEAKDLYLAAHGKPVAFYSDKHSVFRVAQQGAKAGHGMTQFGRAMNEQNIEILRASSSQAKGRVERANRTLQDQLAKEFRLAGISDMEATNAFLPGFMAWYNTQPCKGSAPS